MKHLGLSPSTNYFPSCVMVLPLTLHGKFLKIFQCIIPVFLSATLEVIHEKDPHRNEIITLFHVTDSKRSAQNLLHYLTFYIIMLNVHVFVAFAK